MHGDSINYKGLQIADLISWSVFQKAEHQNAKYIDLMEIEPPRRVDDEDSQTKKNYSFFGKFLLHRSPYDF